jgi:DNA-binding GntR family transcriptional regulator
MAKKLRLANRGLTVNALTPDEVETLAEIGELAYAQLYQQMKAEGMSDEEFEELWNAFG